MRRARHEREREHAERQLLPVRKLKRDRRDKSEERRESPIVRGAGAGAGARVGENIAGQPGAAVGKVVGGVLGAFTNWF